ncbi:hypothetical protein GCM10019991_24070 [Enterococcus casseliflavus]
MARKSVSKFKRSGVKKTMDGEKKKPLLYRFLAESANGYTIGYFLLFLFSSISQLENGAH